ncbi:hypothetical protein F5H01DRAFT_283764 [Linnemannia elongata]|nr:hypothetical protein F5H01DRAFT_283764 [Linnemannia elongata]
MFPRSHLALKRYYACLFSMQKDLADQSGICPPGTVVNTGIIHPFEYGFHM